jgi:hypothetical protein
LAGVCKFLFWSLSAMPYQLFIGQGGDGQDFTFLLGRNWRKMGLNFPPWARMDFLAMDYLA